MSSPQENAPYLFREVTVTYPRWMLWCLWLAVIDNCIELVVRVLT